MKNPSRRLFTSLGVYIGVVFGFAMFGTVLQPASAQNSDEQTVLITGSSRGIGLEFARQYAERGWRVIATCRTPSEADELNELAAAKENVFVEELDVTDDAEIATVASKYNDQTIDVLINNAGILGDRTKQNFGSFDYDEYRRVMDVNVVGVMKVTEAFLENVARSEQKKIVAITSGAGSMEFTTRAGGTFYGVSKAALNMTMRKLTPAVAERGILVGIIEPNVVDTDLVAGMNFSKMWELDEATIKLIELIDDLSPETSGKYIGLTFPDGEFPW